MLRVEPGLQGGWQHGVSLARLRAPVDAVSLRAASAEVEARRARVVWCAVGPEEQRKCQQWSSRSNGTVACATAATTEDCIALVLVRLLLREPVWPAGRTAGSGGFPRSWASV